MTERQERLAAIGQTLHELSDPKSLTRLDPLRQRSRYRLGKEHEKVDHLLAKHGPAFAGPHEDQYALLPPAARNPALADIIADDLCSDRPDPAN